MTEVAVVVQVSPEDRIRIGTNAIVRIELDGGTVSSGSPMRAVRLEDDGSTRITVEWPPGEHHLRVEIEDQPDGRSKSFRDLGHDGSIMAGIAKRSQECRFSQENLHRTILD